MNFHILRIVVVIGLIVMAVIGLVVMAVAVPEIVESDKTYKNFILELIAGTIKHEYRQYMPTIEITYPLKTMY